MDRACSTADPVTRDGFFRDGKWEMGVSKDFSEVGSCAKVYGMVFFRKLWVLGLRRGYGNLF